MNTIHQVIFRRADVVDIETGLGEILEGENYSNYYVINYQGHQYRVKISLTQ